MAIDHTGVNVSKFATSKKFYTIALAPLGYELLKEFDASVTGRGSVAGFGVEGKPDFWIIEAVVNTPPIHVAFRAATRAQVQNFYTAALGAGSRDNGAPGLRPHYHPEYFGAFILDPDGHNIEAVCHAPVPVK
jgi:catechol 2,3-dioxygenase-like lactoylglutathione lyase family enzyme